MKKYRLEEIEPGMILGESVFNNLHNVVLLGEGIVLTERHIALMKNLGIREVYISGKGIDTKEEFENEALDNIINETEKKAKKLGVQFSAKNFKDALNLYEDSVIKKYDSEGISINISEQAPILTGENDIPFDRKHRAMVRETKTIFKELKKSNAFDYDKLVKNVHDSVEDMTINNDILKRLSQLRKDDDYTFQHALRVSMLATMLGKWLGYKTKDLEDISIAGLMFDIGKLKIPEFLYNRADALSKSEYEMYKKHPQLSYTILLKTKGVSQGVRFAALQHHERIDGSGYPLRLKSGQIHPYSKIIMVCDIFDAMLTDRPYQKAVSPFEAAEYLYHHSGVTVDQEITYVFLKNLSEYYVGKKLLLNTGEEGTVVFVDTDFPHQPIIKVKDRIINLHEHSNIKVIKFI
jgi:HD-GYP domain-containing protein (c-di-GMP phosphodiesterase class II)